MNPVPSYGGNVCCTGNAVVGGAFDQRRIEARPDVLVYSSEPLPEGMEVSGPIEVTLYVSSDAKDTDFTVKLLDVDAEGRAYNLDETIQRVRYREGYDRPETRMEAGTTYIHLQPMTRATTSPPPRSNRGLDTLPALRTHMKRSSATVTRRRASSRTTRCTLAAVPSR